MLKIDLITIFCLLLVLVIFQSVVSLCGLLAAKKVGAGVNYFEFEQNILSHAADLLKIDQKTNVQMPISSQTLGLFQDLFKDFPFTDAELHDSKVVNSLGGNLAMFYLINMEFEKKNINKDIPICPNPPIFITGLPATGTFLLQDLMALDPAARTLKRYETLYPVEACGSIAKRIEFAKEEDFSGLHKRIQKAESSSECINVLKSCLHSEIANDFLKRFPTHPSLPLMLYTFKPWCETPTALERQYRHHKQFIQLMNTQLPPPSSHWIFKDPIHLANMGYIHKVYPGAKIVWCHRNLEEQIYSSQFAEEVLKVLAENPHLQERMDKRLPTFFKFKSRREAWIKDMSGVKLLSTAIDYRDSHPQQELFADVYFEDLQRDPIRVVRLLYHKFGLVLSLEHISAMEQWLAENKREPRKYPLAPQFLGFHSKEDMYAAFDKGVYTKRFPRVR